MTKKITVESLPRLQNSPGDCVGNGLAALAGRWESGDAIADDMVRVTQRRTATRAIDDLDDAATAAKASGPRVRRQLADRR